MEGSSRSRRARTTCLCALAVRPGDDRSAHSNFFRSNWRACSAFGRSWGRTLGQCTILCQCLLRIRRLPSSKRGVMSVHPLLLGGSNMPWARTRTLASNGIEVRRCSRWPTTTTLGCNSGPDLTLTSFAFNSLKYNFNISLVVGGDGSQLLTTQHFQSCCLGATLWAQSRNQMVKCWSSDRTTGTLLGLGRSIQLSSSEACENASPKPQSSELTHNPYTRRNKNELAVM